MSHKLKNVALKGFTLIELLVVIAIIGVLATVVVGAVNSARTKGGDAAVKSNLQALRVESELWYDSNNSYGANVSSCPTYSASGTNFFAASQSANNALVAAFNAAKATGTTYPTGLTCKTTASGDAWVAAAVLKTAGQTWCIDSTGVSKQIPTTTAISGTSCP